MYALVGLTIGRVDVAVRALVVTVTGVETAGVVAEVTSGRELDGEAVDIATLADLQ